MSFRTVVITKQSRISYKNRFLVIKQELDEKYIHLNEIDTLIIDSISVSISSYLLKELIDSKINVLFCDEKHNPYSQLCAFYNRYNSSKNIILQSKWIQKKKDELWTNIVKNKITNQALLLKKINNNNFDLLLSYINEVKIGDKTNREGHSAKVYFNALFGKSFSRDNQNEINAALNFGYAVLLSTINKEVISNGYLTQIGIHHKNEFNQFNLSCDLMEVFRPIIDNFVYFNQNRVFDSDYKLDIINIFNNTFKFNNRKYVLKDIIKMYVKNTLNVMNENKKYGEFYNEG